MNSSNSVPSRIVIASRESRLAMWQAVHVRDRLSALYPQSRVEILGMTTRGDQILDRPLADIGPVYGGDAQSATEPAPRRPPVALRLEQTLANGSTPSHTVLGLRRALGCWWITL